MNDPQFFSSDPSLLFLMSIQIAAAKRIEHQQALECQKIEEAMEQERTAFAERMKLNVKF